MISHNSIERVISANPIIDVVSEYITLKRSGSNYRSLCPFHSEKTPSFMVSPSKGIFKCFGCGVGGNVISFVRKIEGITFYDAIKKLAKRANIRLEYDGDSEKYTIREKIFELKPMIY